MLLALGFLALAPSFQHAREARVPRDAHPRRLLVRLDPGLRRTPLSQLHPELELRELWNLPQIGWRAIEVPADRRESAKAGLELDPAVLEVAYDTRGRLAYVPNDPLYPSQWHMSHIQANLAWDTEKGDPSVVVAVVDTGIQLDHPDLAANLWTNPGEIAGNGIDDDNNGWVDDVHGYDFANFDSDPSDDHSHGTGCAGIVAARQDNSIGGSGVAPGCKVAAIKAGLATGYFYASAVVPAFVYCGDMGFQVMSMSFYTDEVVPAERDAIAYCWNQGVLPVVAAGNDNSVLPYYPAGYRQSLSVGATIDASDARAFFSDWGSWVNVAAPGWTLTTTTLFGGYTGGFNGTSGATPHVAGIAALLFSANPSATNADVRAAIEDSSTLLTQAPLGTWTNYGMVNADAALDRILGLTSGSVPPRMTFAAPCGGETRKLSRATPDAHWSSDVVPLEVSGVGLELPNTVEVRSGARTLQLFDQERHSVRAQVPAVPNPAFQLRRNGNLVASWTWEPGPGLLYAASDAGTDDGTGAQASGAWNELYRQDGVNFTCTDDNASSIACQFSVRKVNVRDLTRLTLEFRRDYDGMSGGPIETVEIYDWSSFSYPYGNWVIVSSAAAPTSGFQTLVVDIPGDPNAYRDPEGTLYLRVTTGNATSSGLLKADMLRLRAR